MARDLQALREAIEAVDRDLLGLLRRRMKLVEEVADHKLFDGYPFRDRGREEQVFRRVREAAVEHGLDPRQVELLYRQLLELSVAHQQARVRDSGRAPLRVAYQGVEGSYSHLAARHRYGRRPSGVLLTGCPTFREAAEMVRSGEVDLGLLPIENSTAGSINETYDLLAEGGLSITGEVVLKVEHCLLGLPGARVEELHAVLSHPQALLQCEAFLRSLPGVETRAEFDTAGAARKVRESHDPGLAAIASASAAEVLGLEILRRDLQSQSGNLTRFVEVGRLPAACPPDVPCKTSLMLVLGHRPGALGEVLAAFGRRRINLVKLESRPILGQPWRYRFYLDVEGHLAAEAVAAALAETEEHAEEMDVLGTYPVGEEVTPGPLPPPEG